MDRKKLIEFLGALFVALIFLSSYAAFASNSAQNSTSTSVNVATYYAVGFANATVTGYNGILFVNVSCQKSLQNETFNKVDAAASALEANGSALSSSASSSGFQIAPGNLNSYAIYQNIYKAIGANGTACTSFSTLATVTLPSLLNMSVQGQKIRISVPAASAQQQVDLSLTQNAIIRIPVRASALITQNGIIYGGITISRV